MSVNRVAYRRNRDSSQQRLDSSSLPLDGAGSRLYQLRSDLTGRPTGGERRSAGLPSSTAGQRRSVSPHRRARARQDRERRRAQRPRGGGWCGPADGCWREGDGAARGPVRSLCNVAGHCIASHTTGCADRALRKGLAHKSCAHVRAGVVYKPTSS